MVLRSSCPDFPKSLITPAAGLQTTHLTATKPTATICMRTNVFFQQIGKSRGKAMLRTMRAAVCLQAVRLLANVRSVLVDLRNSADRRIETGEKNVDRTWATQDMIADILLLVVARRYPRMYPRKSEEGKRRKRQRRCQESTGVSVITLVQR